MQENQVKEEWETPNVMAYSINNDTENGYTSPSDDIDWGMS